MTPAKTALFYPAGLLRRAPASEASGSVWLTPLEVDGSARASTVNGKISLKGLTSAIYKSIGALLLATLLKILALFV